MTSVKVMIKVLLATVFLLMFLEFFGQVSYRFYKGYWLSSRPDALQSVTKHVSLHYKPNIFVRESEPLSTTELGLIETSRTVGVDYSEAQKVFFIGGSTVEGQGSSSNKTTIPSFFQACVDNAYPGRYEVHNLGRVGLYSYTSMRLLLEKFVSKARPTKVIQLNGRNDFHYALDESTSGGRYPYSDLKRARLHSLYNGDYAKFLLMHAFDKLVLFKTAGKISQRIFGDKKVQEKLKFDDLEESTLNAVTAYIGVTEATHAYLKSSGIGYFHFFQPTLMYKKDFQTLTEVKYKKIWQEKYPLYQFGLENFYKDVSSRLTNKNLEYNFNLSVLFKDNKAQLYSDSVHYNDQGNKLLGNEICRVFLNYN